MHPRWSAVVASLILIACDRGTERGAQAPVEARGGSDDAPLAVAGAAPLDLDAVVGKRATLTLEPVATPTPTAVPARADRVPRSVLPDRQWGVVKEAWSADHALGLTWIERRPSRCCRDPDPDMLEGMPAVDVAELKRARAAADRWRTRLVALVRRDDKLVPHLLYDGDRTEWPALAVTSRWLIAVGDGELHVWDAATRASVAAGSDARGIRHVDFLADGRLVEVEADAVKVWDPATKFAAAKSWPLTDAKSIEHLAVHPRLPLIAISSVDDVVRLVALTDDGGGVVAAPKIADVMGLHFTPTGELGAIVWVGETAKMRTFRLVIAPVAASAP